MKQICLSLAVAGIFLSAFFSGMASVDNEIVLNQGKTKFSTDESSPLTFTVTNSISSVRTMTVTASKGTFSKLLAPGYNRSHDIGKPELPVLNRLVEIPYNAETEVEVVSFSEKTYDLSDLGIDLPLFPAQPSLSKSTDPATVEFIYDEAAYNKDEDFGYPAAVLEYTGTMRGVRIGRLCLSPFRYNPVQHTLTVMYEMVVTVRFNNADLLKTEAEKSRLYSPHFAPAYAKLINYRQNLTKDQISQYPIKYVIVSDPMFQSALQPFVQWKTRKGFYVVEAYTDNPNVGTTKTSIKSYLQGLYNNGTAENPAPTYVLFVGDVAQIPVFDGSDVCDAHVSDLYYCEYDGGGDWIADIYYGRFSAENVSQLQPQIDKTLEYEQYTMPSPAYLNKIVLVAGVDDAMAPTYGNGQINYATEYYYNTAHGMTTYVYLYGEGTIPSEDPGAPAAIIGNVSDGAGFANYTAHCSSEGWYEPSFSTGDIPGLANAHEYAFMMGNCCLSNKFDDAECFGEAILRAQNKGAVGYIGASNSSLWQEDFEFTVGATAVSANPVYDSHLGLYDLAFHEHSEPAAQWYVSADQMIHSGNLAVTEGGGANQRYYWEMYHLMGDPSLMPYFGVPSALPATYTDPIEVGQTELNVTTEAGAYVAISLDNVLLDAKLADAGGVAHLAFTAFTMPCTADIVATKQFRAPYIGTVEVIEAGPVVANFTGTPLTVPQGGSVQFTDLTSSVGPVTSWSWSFAGGTPAASTVQNPQITYNTVGTFQVSLTASDGTNSDTEIKPDYITVVDTTVLLAQFTSTATVIIAGDTIDFTDLSFGNPDSWSWSFEGGAPATSTTQNPADIIYTTAGTYDVQLIACHDTVCDTLLMPDYIIVMPEGSVAPSADFYSPQTTLLAGQSTTFYDLSSGSPQTWKWTFEGGTPSVGYAQNPTVIYNTVGDYYVRLIVWNPLGYDTLVKYLYIHVIDPDSITTAPEVEFTASQRLIPSGTTIYFTDLSENYPTSWFWSIETESGVFTTSTDQNPANITYNIPGLYDVSLTVSNSYGEDSLTKTQYIVVSDTAWANPEGYCDTITNFTGFIHTFYHLDFTWGYFPGHNGESIKAYADKFVNYTFSEIKAIVVPVKKTIPGISDAYLRFKVWEGDDYPEIEVTSKKVELADMYPNTYCQIEFDSVIPVNGRFFVGYELRYNSTAQDTFVSSMVPNRGASGLNTLYVKKSTTWYTPHELSESINEPDIDIYTSLGIQVIGCLVGIDEIEFDPETEILIYPNPSRDIINVNLGGLQTEVVDYMVFDMTGRMVNVGKTRVAANHYELDFTNQPNGLYFVN
ncbi:MAG: PKD domain-containing protein, partial [Bacteroidetes bacterium]|nr:PKD domain-containing protein [Bacteroidota bacterium]